MDFTFLQLLARMREKVPSAKVDELLAFSADRLSQTAGGGICVQSSVNHRLASKTEVVFEPTPEQIALVLKVVEYCKSQDLVRADRSVGRQAFTASVILPKKYGWIAAYWAATQFDPHKKEADFITLTLPEWPDQRVLVFPDAGITIALGSDYVGETKMSILRLAMYHAKKAGGLGMHAGSKLVSLKTGEKGVLFFGLSGTGKTTLSTHSLFLQPPEKGLVRQDDVVFWQRGGAAFGSEQNFYVKTEGLGEKTHPSLYAACCGDKALLENVAVKEGVPDFVDVSKTSNGRAVVLRRSLPDTDDQVDLQKVDFIFFITRRRDIVPVAAKLAPEQATAFFMLGESVETSAGDPTEAGKTKRVVGFNPFVVGAPSTEGNRFLELLLANKPQVFLLNTGRIGQKVNITADLSAKLVEQAIRGGIEWQTDADWGYEVPSKVGGLDVSALDPRQYYSLQEYAEKTAALKAERKAWLSKFEGLDPRILQAIPSCAILL